MMVQLTETLSVDFDGWRLTETGWDRDRAVALGSNFLVGNGYLGYRGTLPEQSADDYVGLVVTDTYDCADGRWRELTTVPNPLYVAARVDGEDLWIARSADAETWLDLRAGEFGARYVTSVSGAAVTLSVERFASYDELHVIAQRWTLATEADLVVDLDAGIDGNVWSLNGVHLPNLEVSDSDDVLSIGGRTGESGVEIEVAAAVTLAGGELLRDAVNRGERSCFRGCRVALPAGSELIVETAAAVMSSNDGEELRRGARRRAADGARVGYDALREASRKQWASIWEAMDVQIGGNAVDQVALRFGAYHNRICTPAHTDHLPIGARGLSCQAYQGAAFWDQEIYNLPAFLFSEPEIARSLLVYRHRTLDGARRKAARLGYDGAYYAWISGVTGDELCPDIFFKDVLTGRPIRNHFNVWQMHISPDIVTTIARYIDVTGDTEYLIDYGAEIAFEVARFLRSFVRYNDWTETYHCIRLLGPDEWHENVDDNAFTNYQTRAALAFAIDTYEQLAADHPERLVELADRLSLNSDEVERWRRVRDRLFMPSPDPDTKLIEQFKGFFELEDVTADVVRERLLDPSEYWGWPNGVAVATQVSKQADVAMLLWLQGGLFDEATTRANYAYYEARSSHASSLSHAAHGMVAVHVGELERALEHFRATATVDVLNTSHAVVGGTFIGGIHTAGCGGTYQLAVQGFGGLGFSDNRLTIDPRLPASWSSLSYPVKWRDQRISVAAYPGRVEITAHTDNDRPVSLTACGVDVTVGPGETIST